MEKSWSFQIKKKTVQKAGTVNLRVLVEKFTPRIIYVKSGVDFYAQTGSFHRKSHENCDRYKADECARHLAGGRVTISYDATGLTFH